MCFALIRMKMHKFQGFCFDGLLVRPDNISEDSFVVESKSLPIFVSSG